VNARDSSVCLRVLSSHLQLHPNSSLQMLARFSAMATPLSVALPPPLRPQIPSSNISISVHRLVPCRCGRHFGSISTDTGAPVVVSDDRKYGSKQVISLTPQLYEYVLSNVREPQVRFLDSISLKFYNVDFGFCVYNIFMHWSSLFMFSPSFFVFKFRSYVSLGKRHQPCMGAKCKYEFCLYSFLSFFFCFCCFVTEIDYFF
jgi:hypothetical protein